MLFIVAIVAAIYAPPIQLAVKSQFEMSGVSSPVNTGWSGTSKLVSILKELGYNVIVSNSTLDNLEILNENILYIVLGPDLPFNEDESIFILDLLESNRLSFLIAQGNSSNNGFFLDNFGFLVTGDSIVDPSSPFMDNRITYGDVYINSTHTVLLNVASPIVRLDSILGVAVNPIGYTNNQCYDLGNNTKGKRIFAVEILSNNHLNGVVISDSGILINSRINLSEESEEVLFFKDLIFYLTKGNKNIAVLVDNNHHRNTNSATTIPFTLPPLGILLSTFMIEFLENFNKTYNEFLLSTPFTILLGLSVFSLIGTYFGLRNWLGRPKTGFDTPKIPVIESPRLMESRLKGEIGRLKSGGDFYPLTLTQLYYVLNDLMEKEYNVSIMSLDNSSKELIRKRVGEENALIIEKVIKELERIKDKVEGRRRFNFPPILFWKRKFFNILQDIDQVLKSMGTYLMDTEDKGKGIEYRLRKR